MYALRFFKQSAEWHMTERNIYYTHLEFGQAEVPGSSDESAQSQ